MTKNILIITGSPRKKGNSNLMADAFALGARASGHEVTIFESAVNRVGGCIACDTCWKKGTPCSFDDAFNATLSPLLEKADVLVLSSPLYWFTFSTHLKAALDKMYAYSIPNPQRSLQIKECALLMSAAEPDDTPFSGAVESYKHIARFLNMTDRGIVLAPNVNKKGDVLNTDALARAEALGRGI